LVAIKTKGFDLKVLKDKLAGKLIVIDGPDGCGKTTQKKLLVNWLKKNRVKVNAFRDPGDTEIGEKIRKILLNPAHTAMDTRTELLLYMAARAQLWQEKISPALRRNFCVILDRWISSTCAYQGFAGGFGIDNVNKLSKNCLERVWPDLTVILDIDTKTASVRLKKNLDRMEQKGQAYHKKVRQGFLKLAKINKGFKVIKADKNIESIHIEIIKAVLKLK
jgi:dTMP kinase